MSDFYKNTRGAIMKNTKSKKPPKCDYASDFKFGDRRINKRANMMIKKMTKKLGKSIPQIFTTHAELHGAYRFFNNNQVTPKRTLQPHKESTIQRINNHDCVLIIQDSSDVSFDHMECLEGLGKMHPGVEKGIRIHPQLAISEQGTPLGVVDVLMYTRSNEIKSKRHRNQLPIEEKESYRWIEGFISTCELAKSCPNTTFVSVSDREGDIYEYFKKALDSSTPENAYMVVRSSHNRCLSDPSSEIEKKLEQKLIRCPVVYESKVELKDKGKKKRSAHVNIRATHVSIKSPATSPKKKLPPLELNAVMISESDPPPGCNPLHWVLITTLPIETPEQVRRVVSIYASRWGIEIFFKILKSGCKIDSIHFQSVSNINNYIALALIVAWKTMITTYLSREYPDEPCTLLFTELEWKLVYLAVHKKKKPLPSTIPTLKEITQLTASLGGYIKRKSPPGIQTVWRGITRLMDMVEGHELAQEVRKLRKQK